MSLHDKLAAEIKAAMLARNAERLNALRLLKSTIGYLLIERKLEKLEDPDFITTVQKEVKKRKDSLAQYESAGRADLAATESKEITILEEFLPAALSAEELETLVKGAIAEVGATSKKEMGAVMKAAQAKAAGRADGKAISSLVGRLLP